MFNKNIIVSSIQSTKSVFGDVTINNSLHVIGTVNFNDNLFNIISRNKIGINVANPEYTLDINGDINYTGSLLKNGSIVAVETTATSLWSINNFNIWYGNGFVGIGSYFNNNIPEYQLDVYGDTNINGNLFISNNIYINGTTELYSLNVTNNTLLNTLTINGLTILNNSLNIENDLNVLATANINNLNVTNSIICDNLICDNFLMNNDIIFQGNVTCNENITILGDENIYGNIYVNTDKFKVDALTGEVYIYGFLNTASSVSINNSLSVMGNVLISGETTINNNLNVNGNLIITNGIFDMQNISTNNLFVSTNLNVNDNFIINPLINNILINYTTDSIDTNSGSLVIAGGVGIAKDVNIGGNLNVTSNVYLYDLISNNNINCFGSIIGSNLISYNSLTCVDAIISNSINLNNNFIVDSTGNTNINNSLSVQSTLTVENISEFNNDVTINKNLITGGTNNFSGGVIFNSFFINTTSLSINNNQSSIFFVINNVDLSIINLPICNSGTYFKILFLIVPTSLQISSISANIFGLLINNGAYNSVSTSTYITCNCSIGDYIEFYGLDTYYYVNGISSNNIGFFI